MSKGNYGASWGNLYWGQDTYAVSSFPVAMIDPLTKLPPAYMKSAFGFTTTGLRTMTDGSSNTILLSEILQGDTYDIRGMMWSTIPGGSSFMSRLPPNSPVDYYQTGIYGDLLNQTIFCVSEPAQGLPCTGTSPSDKAAYAGARSRHSGGVNCLFGDGSVKFVKNSVSMPTWLALNTASGGEVISADAY
jgi:prepilin-type processing-associated H-X9-DG protein